MNRTIWKPIMTAVVCLAVAVICIAIAVDVRNADVTFSSYLPAERMTSLMEDEEWITANIDSTLVMERTMHPSRNENSLLFNNERQKVRVYACYSERQELLYSVNYTSWADRIHVKCINLVSLPEGSRDYILKLCINGTEGETAQPLDLYVGSRYAVLINILREKYIIVLNLMLLVVMGTVLLTSSLIFAVNHIFDSRMSSALFFLLTTASWGFFDSGVYVIFGVNAEVAGLLGYYSLMLLPVPILSFVQATCRRGDVSFEIMISACYVNVIFQTLVSWFTPLQLNDTLPLTHVVAALQIIFGLIFSWLELKKKSEDKIMRYMYSGFVILSLLTACAIMVYWRGSFLGFKYLDVMLTGVTLFFLDMLLILIVSFGRTLQDFREKQMALKLYEEISLTDSLTNLKNRRAFEKDLEELEKEIAPNEDAILIMIDLNGLKLTNDKFGHSAGDELIVAASKCITASYGTVGSCYRIGGDEFTVIIRNPVKSQEEPREILRREIINYNRDAQYKLSMAIGESHFLTLDQQHKNISNWKQDADIHMYLDKAENRVVSDGSNAQDLKDIIDCVIATVEAKDNYTANHSNRVREMSVVIATWLGLSEDTVEQVEAAAHLHDIGKIGVPDYVLTKPGRLTDEEFGIMKKHPVIGAEIIARAKGMAEIAHIVMHHHERFDGKGYPDGLSKEDIPIASRIIAIADSIDAMTSKRVYREAISLRDCKIEIEKNSGIMYDPAICNIVMLNWSSIEKIVLAHPKDVQHVPMDVNNR